jgi:transposase
VRRNLQQSRQRLSGFLLRHGHHFKEASRWTRKHWAWVKAVEFKEQMLQTVVAEYITAVEMQIEQMRRFDQKIHEISQRPEYAAKVSAYSVLRGIQTRSAMTIIAEGGDLRQYGQAPQFMASIGIVPGEDSTGERRKRRPITKTGNVYLRRILIEAGSLLSWTAVQSSKTFGCDQEKLRSVLVTRRRGGAGQEIAHIF